MLRVFLEVVVPVLVPCLVYFFWLRLRGLRATLRGLAITLAAALGLAATSLVSLSHFGGAAPGTVYVPAHLDASGALVPGRFVPGATP